MKIAPLIEVDVLQFLPQIIGFILFSIIGAVLASRFQYNSWKRQWIVQQTTRRIDSASAAYEEISHVLDKRIYRMKQLVYALQSQNPERIAEKRNDYREVLYQWNENLNKYLAKLQIYFGRESRDKFDNVLGAAIIKLAAHIHRHAEGRADAASTPLDDIEKELDQLHRDAYQFNLELIKKIETNSDFSKL